MRIYLKLTQNKEPVPFDYQNLIVGKLHRWIGENDLHDEISLYSFSQLMRGKKNNESLDFPLGSNFFISSWDNELIKKIIANLRNNPKFIYGMKITEVIIQETPDLSNITNFQIASPILIKRTIDHRIRYFLFNDNESSALMKETLQNKMKKVGMAIDETLDISFDHNYQLKKTKMINYKKGKNIIKNKCNWCPIIMNAKPETKGFAWNVGIGNSTGIGFGAIL